MNIKTTKNEKIVIANAIRTPFAQAGKSFSEYQSYEIAMKLLEKAFQNGFCDKKSIDGMVSGEIGQSSQAPNVARYLSVKLDLPIEGTAVTVANNCVSGYESINEAARRVAMGENEFVLVTGQESMTNFPIYFKDPKKNPKTATGAKILKNWDSLKDDVKIVDAVEEGLTDPVRDANMAETAEVVSQKQGLTKEQLDEYAHQSYSRAYHAIENGVYNPYVVSIEHSKGTLEKDEYIMSKVGMVEKPERFAKASPIFDMPPHTSLEGFYKKYSKWIGKEYDSSYKATVSLFNACPRSDGAAALIVTTETKAKELGLEIQAYIKGWANYGVDPIYMGVGMAYAMQKALKNTDLSWDDIGNFEVHEAFAATAFGTLNIIHKEMGYDIIKRFENKEVNPNGGTLAMGHPLGATGLRVAINQIIGLKDSDKKYSIGAICAGGGVAGSLVLEKP